MTNIILITILSVLNSLLIYGRSFGVNVAIYILLVSIYIVYILKSNKIIKNKKGLLFLIPITLLSLSYIFYDNEFNHLNILVVPLMYALMYIFPIKPNFNIINIVEDIVYLTFEPISIIDKFIIKTKDEIKKIDNSKND